MDTDLKALEEKVAQLVTLCQSLRTESIELRQALAQAQDETKQIKEQMAKASTRLEALIDKLPEGTL
ncbi:MAG TPA: hypothetical protein VK974_11540 [Methylophilaceae bacterium]|nr:hypothetical protein [Methylophilaceae bacterium]